MPAPGCIGCHTAGPHEAVVTTMPGAFGPGETVRVTVTLTAASGVRAGVFVDDDIGTQGVVSGGGLIAAGTGLTHASPRALSNGSASFSFDWTAPHAAGAVRFDVSSVIGNGNNGSSGDQAAASVHDFVFGCEPATYYADFDGDGYGRADMTRIHCAGAPPEGYALTGDDCDDNREAVHPGAVELCNERDDDCDDEIDDDYQPVQCYPDRDGDGYYGVEEGQSDDTYMGCPEPGYASEPGDCDPYDAAIHPGAEEVCNLYDDDCDGRVDEFVRPICGIGWCQRAAESCEASACVPGEPSPEQCNLLDDDCDDAIDEGEICPDGEACVLGVCAVASGSTNEGGSVDAEAEAEAGGPAPEASAGAEDGGEGCACRSKARPRLGLLALVLLGCGVLRRRRT